jgi:alkanesulfonate monooxygenase SsuD/methylene tetrahydromethanopterin reductase-like flavin-dependent oxidoreductase (luciferase family)
MAATFRGGSQVAQMDPVVFISAMAAVTQSVAFGVTGSTSYITPYILARTVRDLLHMLAKSLMVGAVEHIGSRYRWKNCLECRHVLLGFGS